MQSKFEQAVHHVVDGRLEELQTLLQSEPDLVHGTSSDRFHATLLHFVAANGVPDGLQRTPPNAVEICSALIQAGVDPNAACEAYGGGPNNTPLCLLVSSYHPFAAGLQTELVRVLVAGGALVNGRLDDGAPLATALVFGYSRAAETLVAVGARVDNIFFAAGLGDLDSVKSYFGESGHLVSAAEGAYSAPVARPAHADANSIVQEAFHFAIGSGRLETASWLLGKGASIHGPTRGHHCELPLVQAAFLEREQTCDWLIQQGADPNQVDGKRDMSARQHVATHGSPAMKSLMTRYTS